MSAISLSKAGLLTRIGNIVVGLIAFVFLALVLVVFYPPASGSIEDRSRVRMAALQQMGDKIAGRLAPILDRTESPNNRQLHAELAALFAKGNYHRGHIIVRGAGGRPEPLFSFQNIGTAGEDSLSHDEVDLALVGGLLERPAGLSLTTVDNPGTLRNYLRVDIAPGRPAVIIGVYNHGLLLADKSSLRDWFVVLFLVTLLLALGLVFLIGRRIVRPLGRLAHGIEQTVEGQLHFIVDNEQDRDLSALIQSYNGMVQHLREHNDRLASTTDELQHAHYALAHSLTFLHTIIENSPSCVITTDLHGKVIIFNRFAEKAFAVSPDHILGHPIDELFTRPLDELLKDRDHPMTPGTAEVLCRRGDDEYFPATVTWTQVSGSDNAPLGCVYIVQDISQSKSFQEMMIRIDRYYTRGEMAGDIAHEINNFLAVLSGNLELMPLLLRKNDMEKIEQKLTVMRNTVDRIARFTDGLMDVGGDEARFERVDINHLVETVLAFLKPQNRFDEIELDTRLATSIPQISLDSGQIQQLLVNLVYNASDVLSKREGDKRIVITTSLVRDNGSSRARVVVHDNGPGVPDDRRGDLFEQRFTTKRKGHGIGLLTCRRIVDSHAGRIGYEYSDGAVFWFELPLTQQPRPAKPSVDQPAETVA